MQIEIKGTVVWRHEAYPECEKCEQGIDLLMERGIRFATVVCDKKMFGSLMAVTKSQNVPQFHVDGEYVGGLDDLITHLDKM